MTSFKKDLNKNSLSWLTQWLLYRTLWRDHWFFSLWWLKVHFVFVICVFTCKKKKHTEGGQEIVRRYTIQWMACEVLLSSPVASVCSETNACMFLHKCPLHSCLLLFTAFTMFALSTAHSDYLCDYPSSVAFCSAARMLLHPAVTPAQDMTTPGPRFYIEANRLLGGGM